MASISWKKLAIITLFAGGLAAFFALGGDRWLTLESLKQNRAALLEYTQMHRGIALAAAVLIYTASTALSIPGAAVLSLAVGLIFGRWVGTVVIVFAATTGATLVFLAARYLFADAVRRRLGGVAAKIIAGFHANAFSHLLFLRLAPLFPFWLVNLAPALTAISLRTYVSATALGIIPGSFVFANLGQSLGRIESVEELLSFKIFAAFTLLGLFALLPIAVKRLRAGKAHRPEPNPPRT